MNKSHAFHSTTRRRGAILVLALAVVALAGSSVLHSHLVARARMKADREALRASILDAAMEDAARNAILLLAEDSDLLVDHLAKPWAKPHEITTPAGVDLFVAIEDLNRYFDLNNLCTHADEISTRPAEDMLADLLLGLGDYESTEHAATLRDWMDSGEDGPRERHWYDEQGLNIRPPNRPLTGFSEWIGIPGFTREFVERKSDRPGATAIQDHLTIIPFARNRPIPINVNTATPDVLRCVLGTAHPAIAETILAVRDRTPLASLDSLVATLPLLEVSTAHSFFSVRSDWFQIKIHAYFQRQSATARVMVYRAPDGAIEVKQWVK